jgi:hypothetical protein
MNGRQVATVKPNRHSIDQNTTLAVHHHALEAGTKRAVKPLILLQRARDPFLKHTLGGFARVTELEQDANGIFRPLFPAVARATGRHLGEVASKADVWRKQLTSQYMVVLVTVDVSAVRASSIGDSYQGFPSKPNVAVHLRHARVNDSIEREGHA